MLPVITTGFNQVYIVMCSMTYTLICLMFTGQKAKILSMDNNKPNEIL